MSVNHNHHGGEPALPGRNPGRRVLITRPRPDAEASAARLAAHGWATLIAPVLAIVQLDVEPPGGDVDAVVVTSAHAVPALVRHRRQVEALPLFAVGPRTAEALRLAGFGSVTAADGSGFALAALIAARLRPGARLLHAAGRERKSEPDASLSSDGFVLMPWIVYAAEAEPRLPATLAAALATECLSDAVHYSRRSLEILLDLAEAAGLAPALLGLRHACLSQDVAEPLRARRAPQIKVAARPDEAALFDALLAGAA